MTLEDKQAYWQRMISEWELSKLSQPVFCKEHDINYTQFCTWRYKFNKIKNPQSGEFIPVKVSKEIAKPTTIKALNVCLPEGITLSIDDESQISMAAKLLKALR